MAPGLKTALASAWALSHVAPAAALFENFNLDSFLKGRSDDSTIHYNRRQEAEEYPEATVVTTTYTENDPAETSVLVCGGPIIETITLAAEPTPVDPQGDQVRESVASITSGVSSALSVVSAWVEAPDSETSAAREAVEDILAPCAELVNELPDAKLDLTCLDEEDDDLGDNQDSEEPTLYSDLSDLICNLVDVLQNLEQAPGPESPDEVGPVADAVRSRCEQIESGTGDVAGHIEGIDEHDAEISSSVVSPEPTGNEDDDSSPEISSDVNGDVPEPTESEDVDDTPEESSDIELPDPTFGGGDNTTVPEVSSDIAPEPTENEDDVPSEVSSDIAGPTESEGSEVSSDISSDVPEPTESDVDDDTPEESSDIELPDPTFGGGDNTTVPEVSSDLTPEPTDNEGNDPSESSDISSDLPEPTESDDGDDSESSDISSDLPEPTENEGDDTSSEISSDISSELPEPTESEGDDSPEESSDVSSDLPEPTSNEGDGPTTSDEDGGPTTSNDGDDDGPSSTPEPTGSDGGDGPTTTNSDEPVTLTELPSGASIETLSTATYTEPEYTTIKENDDDDDDDDDDDGIIVPIIIPFSGPPVICHNCFPVFPPNVKISTPEFCIELFGAKIGSCPPDEDGDPDDDGEEDDDPTTRPDETTKQDETSMSSSSEECTETVTATYVSVICTVTGSADPDTEITKDCSSLEYTTVSGCSVTNSETTTTTTKDVEPTEPVEIICEPGTCDGDSCEVPNKRSLEASSLAKRGDPSEGEWYDASDYDNPNEFLAGEVFDAYHDVARFSGRYVRFRPFSDDTTSNWIQFKDEPVSLAAAGLYGCTTLVMVSNRGAWANHMWERNWPDQDSNGNDNDPSFMANVMQATLDGNGEGDEYHEFGLNQFTDVRDAGTRGTMFGAQGVSSQDLGLKAILMAPRPRPGPWETNPDGTFQFDNDGMPVPVSEATRLSANTNQGQQAWPRRNNFLINWLQMTYPGIDVEVVDYNPMQVPDDFLLELQSLENKWNEEILKRANELGWDAPPSDAENEAQAALNAKRAKIPETLGDSDITVPRGKALLQYKPAKDCQGKAQWRVFVDDGSNERASGSWSPFQGQIWHGRSDGGHGNGQAKRQADDESNEETNDDVTNEETDGQSCALDPRPGNGNGDSDSEDGEGEDDDPSGSASISSDVPGPTPSQSESVPASSVTPAPGSCEEDSDCGGPNFQCQRNQVSICNEDKQCDCQLIPESSFDAGPNPTEMPGFCEEDSDCGGPNFQCQINQRSVCENSRCSCETINVSSFSAPGAWVSRSSASVASESSASEASVSEASAASAESAASVASVESVASVSSASSAAASPTTAMELGNQECHGSDEFPSKDVHAIDVGEFADFICNEHEEVYLDKDSDPWELILESSSRAAGLHFLVEWVDDCRTTADEQRLIDPLDSDNPDMNVQDTVCSNLFWENWANCNNKGKGGHRQAGCLKYTLYPF